MPKEGEVKSIYLKDHEICILQKDGQYHAMDDSCPHAGASLGMGKCQNEWLICPKHDIRFNIKTGISQTERFKATIYPIKKIGDDWYLEIP